MLAMLQFIGIFATLVLVTLYALDGYKAKRAAQLHRLTAFRTVKRFPLTTVAPVTITRNLSDPMPWYSGYCCHECEKGGKCVFI